MVSALLDEMGGNERSTKKSLEPMSNDGCYRPGPERRIGGSVWRSKWRGRTTRVRGETFLTSRTKTSASGRLS
jgi:hypothetical protein